MARGSGNTPASPGEQRLAPSSSAGEISVQSNPRGTSQSAPLDMFSRPNFNPEEAHQSPEDGRAPYEPENSTQSPVTYSAPPPLSPTSVTPANYQNHSYPLVAPPWQVTGSVQNMHEKPGPDPELPPNAISSSMYISAVPTPAAKTAHMQPMRHKISLDNGTHLPRPQRSASMQSASTDLAPHVHRIDYVEQSSTLPSAQSNSNDRRRTADIDSLDIILA